VVRSEGRQFPVEVEHLGLDPGRPLEERVAQAVRRGVAAGPGDVLAFLPGGREIGRARATLGEPAGVRVLPLHGDLPRAAQDEAIRPAPRGIRKVVLATNVAETSLTIEGVSCVVDGGLERRPRFSPRTGMSRLVTVPVSRASAEQRRGRAGRLGPGLCLRLWSAEEDRALAPYRPAEIEEADLAPLALDLAAWGVSDPAGLAWPTPPPAGAYAQARRLLAELGALDDAGGITPHGRAMAELPLHPRLAHMLLRGAGLGLGAAALAAAALLSGRDPDRAAAGVDLAPRVLRAATADDPAWRDVRRVRDQLARAARISPGGEPRTADVGAALALAYPDRVAQRRGGAPGHYKLANGRGARLDERDPLATEPWLVAAELDDAGIEARVRSAAALDGEDLARLFANRVTETDEFDLDPRTGAVAARRVTRMGELVLKERLDPAPDPERVARVLLDEVRRRGLAALSWGEAARGLRARVALLRGDSGPDAWPDLGDEALLATAEGWLLPHLVGRRRLADLERLDLAAVLAGLLEPPPAPRPGPLGPDPRDCADRLARPVDYGADPPALAVRLQELFGLAETPAVNDGRTPLVLRLLSPASRPRRGDARPRRLLAGLLRRRPQGAARALPEAPVAGDPLAAAPTRRAKPRGT
jgi:ATP-dependent helicase HrpB